MKVFLRIPTNLYVDAAVTEWYGWVTREDPTIDASTHLTGCYGIAEGRNDIVREFLKTDCTHLWFVDADTQPPHSLGLFAHIDEHPIVCGPYPSFKQGVGYVWHVYKHLGYNEENNQHHYGSIRPGGWPKDPLFPADAAGTGCMVIRRDVLEGMSAPWFAYEYHTDGTRGTEDMAFCRKAGGVMMDRAYVCGHNRAINLLEGWNQEQVKVHEAVRSHTNA